MYGSAFETQMLSSKVIKLASTNYRLRQLLGGLFGLNVVGLLLEN